MTAAAVDVDNLPPTQYLILEVLAARYRTGEQAWTFPNRVRPALEALSKAGLLSWKSSSKPGLALAWLTDAGRAAALSPTYEPPASDTMFVVVQHSPGSPERFRRRLDSVIPHESTDVAEERAAVLRDIAESGGRWMDQYRVYELREVE